MMRITNAELAHHGHIANTGRCELLADFHHFFFVDGSHLLPPMINCPVHRIVVTTNGEGFRIHPGTTGYQNSHWLCFTLNDGVRGQSGAYHHPLNELPLNILHGFE